MFLAHEPFNQEVTWKGATTGYFSVFSHHFSSSSWQSRSAGVCWWVLGAWPLWAECSGDKPRAQSHLQPVPPQPSSCCCRSLCSQLCPHTPCLSLDLACASTATLHPGMKCHFGVVVSPQAAFLGKQFCTIASFLLPNTLFLRFGSKTLGYKGILIAT